MPVDGTHSLADVATSRKAILDAILPGHDLTFVHGPGNHGDELIWAGVRQLLRGVAHREIGLEGLAMATGEVGLLSGAGGFSAAFHEQMPLTLEMMTDQFERVVVLPSSFDPSVPDVRHALTRTTATVFAREPVSFDLIRDLCDARLALDCAFFADLSAYRDIEPHGVLNAFRTDGERRHADVDLPDDNLDVSLVEPDLDAFVRRIARAELVRTDRTHVMITASQLGRTVEYRPAAGHKVTAIAEWALADRRVTRLPGGPAGPTRVVVAPSVDPGFVLEADPNIEVDARTAQTLEHALREHPEADAASPMLIRPNGDLRYAGGRLVRVGELIEAQSSAASGAPGFVDWAPAGGTLWRRGALVPVDPAVGRFGTIERALRQPSRIVYVPSAVALDTAPDATPPADEFTDRTRRLRAAAALAIVHERHGVMLADFFDEFPWMSYAGRHDMQSARLLFRLLRAEGLGGMHRLWATGDIAPLFRGPL